MANYINTQTGQYPMSETAIRAAFPNTSFPAQFVPPPEYSVVFPAPAPSFDAITQGCREIAPVLTDKGRYEQAYEIFALDAETIAANQAAKVQTFIKTVEEATQKRLDTFAQTKGYDNIISACSYATSASKYGDEGRYCVSAREATWDALFQLMAEVQAGTKPMPGSVEEVMAILPVLEWPVVA